MPVSMRLTFYTNATSSIYLKCQVIENQNILALNFRIFRSVMKQGKGFLCTSCTGTSHLNLFEGPWPTVPWKVHCILEFNLVGPLQGGMVAHPMRFYKINLYRAYSN